MSNHVLQSLFRRTGGRVSCSPGDCCRTCRCGVKHATLSSCFDVGANVTQTVLDCRRAVAWLEAQPEVDAGKIGLLGTSLGSLVGGTVAGVEPKIRTACLLLGGGGLVNAYTGSPILDFLWPLLKLAGISKDQLAKQIAPIDPITYAEGLKTKRLLLIAASRDDVVPPQAMKSLWESAGKPKLVWVEATHVGAVLHLFQMMRAVTDFVKE